MSEPTLRTDDRRVVANGKLMRLSVSQITAFDPGQYGGCERRWFFRYVLGYPEPDTGAKAGGSEKHAEIEHYLKTGEDVLSPQLRAGKHFIPEPSKRTQLVEFEFGKNLDQPKLIAAGFPLNGKIDLIDISGSTLTNEGHVRKDPEGTIEVIDWKTTSNIPAYAKRGEQLIETVQMTGYGIVAEQVGWLFLGRRPDFVRLSHGYFQTRGANYAEKRSALISLETVKKSWSSIEKTAARMGQIAGETDPAKVDPNYASCGAWKGCPHKKYCPKSPDQSIVANFSPQPTQGVKPMSLRSAAAAQLGGTPAAQNIPAASPPATLQAGHAVHTAPPAAPGGTLARAGVRANLTAAPTVSTAGPAVEVDPMTALMLERARLDAEEAAIRAAQAAPAQPQGPHCPACGERLHVKNISILPDKTMVHIGCPRVPAAVAPPDQPASHPATAATPIPPDQAAQMSPELRARAEAHAAQVAALQAGHAVHTAPPAAVTALPTSTPQASPIEPVKRRGPKPKCKTCKKPLPCACSPATPALALTSPPTSQTASQGLECDMEEVVVLIDCTVSGFGEVEPLDRWLQSICDQLAAKYGAADLRCAPKDSPLSFAGWKGALSAAIKESPLDSGVYSLMHCRESEIRQIAAEALQGLADIYIRGV